MNGSTPTDKGTSRAPRVASAQLLISPSIPGDSLPHANQTYGYPTSLGHPEQQIPQSFLHSGQTYSHGLHYGISRAPRDANTPLTPHTPTHPADLGVHPSTLVRYTDMGLAPLGHPEPWMSQSLSSIST